MAGDPGRALSGKGVDVAWALLLVAVVVGLACVVAPHAPLHPIATPLVVFVGAITTSLAALFVASRAELTVSRQIALSLLFTAVLIGGWVAPPSRPLGVAVDVALVGLTYLIGSMIGSRIEHPGHLLPAAVVAAAADVISVVSPEGPSHAIASSEHALSVVAFSFPALGTRELAPALGAGDLVMVAIFLCAARKHSLPVARVAALAWGGALLAGIAAAVTERAIPALPAIGAMVVLGVPGARRMRAKDRSVAIVAMIVAVGMAAVVVVRGFAHPLTPA